MLSRGDRIVSIVFRLFIGGLVMVRLLAWFSTPERDELDDQGRARTVTAKLDALLAGIESAEQCRRAYDVLHDGRYLAPCRDIERTIGVQIGAIREVATRPAEVRALALLEPATQSWVGALASPERRPAARPRNVSEPAQALRDFQYNMPPLDRRAIAEEALASRIVSLGLTLTELAVLVAANMVFHRMMRRRMNAENDLRKKEQFARSTVDALGSHIAILDCDGVILATNRAWREFAANNGADIEAVCEGANYLIACDTAGGRHCEEASRFAYAIHDVLAGRIEDFSIEYPAHSPKERRWFAARVTRFPGNDGRVNARHVARLVISHDNITSRKVVEEALQKAKEQAEFANLAKSAFLANTSHELRTPMTAILGYAEIMLDSAQGYEERKGCIQTIRRNGEHLLSIINDLLDISKIEAQKVTVEKLSYRLPQLVAEVIGLTRPRAIEKGLNYDIEFLGDMPATIETDPLRTKQVLVNLIGNAIKFTESGGIRVRVRCDISFFRQTLHFDVIDSGIGMTQSQIDRLFQPFTQADESTTRRFGGTGLGLTISQRLARLLGGDIAVQSTPGSGSTFSFHLDAGQRTGEVIHGLTLDQLSIAPARTVPEPQTQTMTGRLLLAEDAEDNQRLIAAHLRKAGLEVLIAANGIEAIDAVGRERFDLILMDMQMPEMDGYTAARQLRKSGLTIPIIALTASAMPEDRSRCLDAGCTDYLAKPLSRAQLLIAVAKFLVPGEGRPDRREGAGTLSADVAGTGSTTYERVGADQSPSNATPVAAIPAPLMDQPAPTVPQPAVPLRSAFLNDPTVCKLLHRFVERLPERAQAMALLIEAEDVAALRQVVHQLKGAGGGYGFPKITELAGITEDHIRAQADLDLIRRDVDSLIALVRSVDGYDRGRETAKLPAEPAHTAG